MLCSSCNTENPTAAKYCVECGAPFSKRCPNCGLEDLRQSKFCAECGTSLRERASQTKGGVAFDPVESISLAAAEIKDSVTDGERKTVTAVFVDIKGSTELMEELDAEDVRALIDPALRIMSQAVHRYDGYIVQSTGDGIFALFGAPVAHEEHPQLALHSALALQVAIKRHSAKLVADGYPPIVARVGVSTGEVVLRTLRTSGHIEYTPVGLTVNLAQRMQTVAPSGSIAISENTQRLIEGYFELKPLGPALVSGIKQPINVFEVMAAGPVRTHFDLSARRGLTKFVGREREIIEMERALGLASSGRGQIVAAVADAGTGKSRLLHEFKRLVPDHYMMLETYSVSRGKASVYQPVLEMLQGYFGIEGGDNYRIRRTKISTKLWALDPALKEILPYILALFGIRDTPDPLAQMNGAIKRRRTLEALKHIVLRESLIQTLVVVFEDLHWIDEESQAFLNLLADSIANARIMLLVNYRPEYRQNWSGKSYYTQLRLDPLDKESGNAMLIGLLGDSPELQHLKRLILEKTGGNPFFIEEMVQALLEQGVLARNGGVKVIRSLTQLEVPPTVHGVLASRIDRLPAEEKDLLQTLAVVGRQFPLSLIKRLVNPFATDKDSGGGFFGGEQNEASEKLRQMLSSLQLREFIQEQPMPVEVEYIFKHSLTQDVAYRSVLTERRNLLHERIAMAIEDLFVDRLDDHLSDLAHHYRASTNFAKAVNYLYLAGRQAAGRSAHSEALAYFADGLELLKKLPAAGDRIRLELLLQIGSGFSLRATKGFTAPEVEQALTRARELCREAKEDTQLFHVLVGLHTFYMFGPNLQMSRELAKQLLALAEAIGEPTKLATAYLALGQTTTYLGECRASQGYFERAIELGSQHGGLGQNALGYLGPTLWSLGYPTQAADRMREALAIVGRESTLPLLAANILAYAGTLYTQMRHWEESKRCAEAGLVLANQHGFLFHIHMFTLFRGRALIQEGENERGISEMDRGIAGLDALGAGRPFLIGYAADGCLRASRIQDGLRMLAKAAARTEETGEQWTLADLHRLRGEALLMEDSSDTKRAEDCFRKAIEVAEQQSERSFELRAKTSLARLLIRQGRRRDASKMLSEIYGWFTEGFDTADLRDAKLLIDELGD